MFSINWVNYIKILLPTALKTTTVVSWLLSLVNPIMILYNQFIGFRVNSIYRITHTGQVCSLEDVLNDRYDSISHRIKLSDDTQNINYVCKVGETPVMYVPKLSEWTAAPSEDKHYIGYLSEYIGVTVINVYDGMVPLPISQLILNTVEPYRMAGKQFKVNYTSAIPD